MARLVTVLRNIPTKMKAKARTDKDVKTPFVFFHGLSHVVNNVAICRETRKDG